MLLSHSKQFPRFAIWPKGKMPDPQPHLIAAMTDEADVPGFNPDEYREPYLEWFEKPANPNGTCMILISGGGYSNCCDVGLIKMWHENFTAIGCQCVNFVYRTPRPEGLAMHQVAWEDGQRAVRIVRSEAAKRGFNPERIGTMSMSAGSHLATMLATSSQTRAYAPVDELDDVPCHINWAITGAIAYALTDGLGVPNSRNGDMPDVKLDTCFRFDEKTCPMCMLHGGLDPYSPNASTQVYRQLRRMGIPAELHLFADRSHGFWGDNPDKENSTAYDNWFKPMREFMTQMGFIGPVPPEEDLLSRFPDDNARCEYIKEDIWTGRDMPDVQPDQCMPYIEWHIPKTLKTKAIQIMFSGGCYTCNDTNGFEVAPARRYFNQKGMTVVTLKYRAPRPQNGLQKHVTAWEDLQRAIKIVRKEAPARGLDPERIGIMGSSAGGHLALMGATSSRHNAYYPIDNTDSIKCTPQWTIAIYPAYAISDGYDGGNTTGGNGPDIRIGPEFVFDPDTCPICFIHGDADHVASMNSVLFWEQLRRMGIQCDLHTLAKRCHCFQRTASPGTGSYSWLDHIWEFMNHKKYVS